MKAYKDIDGDAFTYKNSDDYFAWATSDDTFIGCDVRCTKIISIYAALNILQSVFQNFNFCRIKIFM